MWRSCSATANESTRDRTKGVEEVVAKYPNIKIVQKQTAKFTRNDAVDVVSNWMTSGEDIRAIASNNDEMAIGALQALGKTRTIFSSPAWMARMPCRC